MEGQTQAVHEAKSSGVIASKSTSEVVDDRMNALVLKSLGFDASGERKPLAQLSVKEVKSVGPSRTPCRPTRPCSLGW